LEFFPGIFVENFTVQKWVKNVVYECDVSAGQSPKVTVFEKRKEVVDCVYIMVHFREFFYPFKGPPTLVASYNKQWVPRTFFNLDFNEAKNVNTFKG
jgi:hypothetical protein